MPDLEKKPEEKLSGVLRSGTGAGILVALAVIAIFILAATFLKSLVFGIILACFFLPLEKFFEKKFLQWRGVRMFCSLSETLTAPFRYLRDRLAGKKQCTPEEAAEKQRRILIARACITSSLTFVLALVLIFLVLGYLLIPAAVSTGNKIKQSQSLKQTLERIEHAVNPPNGPEENQPEGDHPKAEKPTEEKDASFRHFVQTLRQAVPEYLEKYHKDIANLAFKSGRGLLAGFISMISSFGTFAFNLLLTIFFFFFFLQRLALFKSGSRENQSFGNWCVRGIFGTRWMPEVSEISRREAVGIIDWITDMFVKWIRGYLWIILIEIPLYLISFSLWNVPYAPVLAVLSGMTILLPYLGLVCNVALTTTVCLVFCTDHVAGTLIGVYLTYLVVNGILEQLFLYPRLVGGALELTTVETIIAVLLGGLIAGIPGMILAVPAAAILKFLVPKIYQAVRKTK